MAGDAADLLVRLFCHLFGECFSSLRSSVSGPHDTNSDKGYDQKKFHDKPPLSFGRSLWMRCSSTKNHVRTRMRGEWRVGAGSVFCQGALLEGEAACALVGCSAGGDGFVSRQVGEADLSSGRTHKGLTVVWQSHSRESWASLYSCSWRVSNAALPRWRENQTAKRNAIRNQLSVNKAKPRRAIWM